MEGLIMDIKEKVNQFRQFFLDEVRRKAEATNDITETSFVEVFCKYLADEGIISDFQYAHYERAQKPGRKKSRVDGFSPNVVENGDTCDCENGNILRKYACSVIS